MAFLNHGDVRPTWVTFLIHGDTLPASQQPPSLLVLVKNQQSLMDEAKVSAKGIENKWASVKDGANLE